MKKWLNIVTVVFTVWFSLDSRAADIQTVSNMTELVDIVNSTWVSNSVNKIMPPGGSEYANSYGAVAFAPAFDTNFIASLLPVTNSIGTNDFLTYPLEVSETTGTTGRVRNYYSAISTNPAIIHYETVDMSDNYPVSWIENVYGEAPQWLSGSDLQKWYDDRDPWRQHVYCDLIATGDVPYYLAMLTNTFSTYTGTNTNSTLSVYSNNIVFFDTASADGGDVSFYLHAPHGVAILDLFRNETNHLQSSGWQLAGTLEHNADPLLLDANVTTSAPLFYCAGDAVIDSDGDGIPDAREMRIFGTSAGLADTDGDGVNDGVEILNYGMNALKADSDADGMTDLEEMQYLHYVLKCWGDDAYNQTAVPPGLTDVLKISAGGIHNLVLREDHTVTAWGDNSFGQCNVPSNLAWVTDISAGLDFSMALTNGALAAWGTNDCGQCDGPTNTSARLVKISAGYKFGLALDEFLIWKYVRAWGDNSYGQCNVPSVLTDGSATDIAAGAFHCLGLRDNGTVIAWGRNDYGQCNVPSSLTNVVQISAGNYHNLALCSDETVAAWGRNNYGQCNVPSNLTDVISISAGGDTSMALLSNNTVVIWGRNDKGQCDIPGGQEHVKVISAGGLHCMAVAGEMVINPTAYDTDGDGLSDGWEVGNDLDPVDPNGENGAYGDPDNDGLINMEEQQYGTKARDYDTDDDYLPDGFETTYSGFDPLVYNDPMGDGDSDGLSNLGESQYGTNPNLPDTDGGNSNDGTEIANGTNPNDPSDDITGAVNGKFIIEIGRWECGHETGQPWVTRIGNYSLEQGLYGSVNAKAFTVYKPGKLAGIIANRNGITTAHAGCDAGIRIAKNTRVDSGWGIFAKTKHFPGLEQHTYYGAYMFQHWASWYNGWTQWAGWSTNNSFGWINGCSRENYNDNSAYDAIVKTDKPDIYIMKVNLSGDNNCDEQINSADDAIEENVPLCISTNEEPRELRIEVSPAPPDGFTLTVSPVDSTKLRLWLDKAKTQPVTQDFVYGVNPPPDKVYVEALSGSLGTTQKVELALYPVHNDTIVPVSGVPSAVTYSLTIAKDMMDILVGEVKLESAKATKSPVVFRYNSTNLYDPGTYVTGTLPTNPAARATENARILAEEQKKIDSALTIYYKDVIDSSGNIENFDVKLKVIPEFGSVAWSETDVPANSGFLTDSDQTEATYHNPTKGGVYIFDLDEGVSETTTRTQMWLPVAGPDITSYWSSEVERIRTWGTAYRSNLQARAEAEVNISFPWIIAGLKYKLLKNDFLKKTSDGYAFGLDLDWVIESEGAMYSNGRPAGLADVYTEDSSAGDNQRFTICGKVIDFAKRNNMGYALIAKEMGFPRYIIINGPDAFYYSSKNGSDVGTPDSAATKESYQAGCDLSEGIPLQTVMDNHGLKMLEPGMRAEKEWPSSEITSAGLQLYEPANTIMEELINE